MKKIATLLIVCFVFVISVADAQQRKIRKISKNKNKIIRRVSLTPCGDAVLNNIAVVLPTPAYPSEAKSAGNKGLVTVQAKIDEEGNVIETRACSGDFLLRGAAVEAAKQAKFRPTFSGGKPVEVSGTIVYNFDSKTSKHSSAVENQNENVVILSCLPSKNFIKILNGYVTNLVKPEFPQELQERELFGAVNVQVLIDETGKLIFATAVSGHQELRSYAEEASRKSTFKRFERCGKPVNVSSIIVYNFAPSK